MGERRSLDGGSRRRTENGADDAEDLPAEEQYEPEHGHTLSAMQGRGMRRELSRHTFFGVEGFEGEPVVTADDTMSAGSPTLSPLSTPSHTLTGAESSTLSQEVEASKPKVITAADRRPSMPASAGHARLDDLFPVPEKKPAVAAQQRTSNGSDASEEEVTLSFADVDGKGTSDDKKQGKSALERLMDAEARARSNGGGAGRSVNARASIDVVNRSGGSFGFGSARFKPSNGESSKPKPRKSAGAGAGGETSSFDRREALRAVARDVESLMLISEALSAKDMPVLSRRLRHGLTRIQDNARVGYKDEGLHARKVAASHRVNRWELFKEAAHEMTLDKEGRRRMSMAGQGILGSIPSKVLEELDSSVHGGGHGERGGGEALTLKQHVVRASIVGFSLLILCCIPHIVHQYAPDAGIQATTGSFTLGADPVLMPLSHRHNGLYEITVGAGVCEHQTPAADSAHTNNTYYQAKIELVQDGEVLRYDKLKLHDLGTAAAAGRRRGLLGVGGGGGPVGADVYDHFYFDVRPNQAGSYVNVRASSDCPVPVGLSIEAITTGPIGSVQHWIALALLIAVFALIITEVVHRTLIAFMGAASVLFILALEHRLPSVYTIMGWMDHSTLALLWGMMVIVALLARSGIFEFCSVRLIEFSKGDMWRLTLLLMLFDCILSAFLDNVSTMLLMGPVIISLCKAIDMDPRPMLIPMALFGNIGGTSTMIGDPPNLIIGNAFKEEIGFVDFMKVLAPGVILVLFPTLFFLKRYYGKEVYDRKIDVDMQMLRDKYPIRDHALLARCGIILGFVLMLFFLHPVVHFEPAYAALFGAIAILLMGSTEDFEHAIEKVEWDSLLFFAGLFVFTEGIAELGLLRIIADQLSGVIEKVPVGQRAIVSSALIQVVAAVASAFVDNIPFTTTMIPVIRRMATNVEGLEIQPLAWALCFGADMGGMGTIIGASANVVMAGIAAEAGYPVSFMSFFRIGWPMMCIAICVTVPYLCLMIQVGYV